MVATNDIGTEVATLLTGPAWSGQRVVELGSMVTADEVAEQLGEVLNLDVKAFAVPRVGWAEAFEQFGIPKGHTGPAEEMFEAVNAGWMDLGVEGTEHVAGTTSARFRGGPEGPDGVNRDVHTRRIVGDALAKGHSVGVLVRSKARAPDLPGSRYNRGRCSIASPTTGTSSRPATRAGASRIAPSVPAFAPAAQSRPVAPGRALPLLPAVTWGALLGDNLGSRFDVHRHTSTAMSIAVIE